MEGKGHRVGIWCRRCGGKCVRGGTVDGRHINVVILWLKCWKMWGACVRRCGMHATFNTNVFPKTLVPTSTPPKALIPTSTPPTHPALLPHTFKRN
eukprot:356095-Chlamydomonas_euryale.AAC.3